MPTETSWRQNMHQLQEHHTKGYASLAEMAAAMDDPRYEKDMAYTERVERRIIASDF